MKDVLDRIKQIGVVPVIKIENAEKAVPLAQALLAGGLGCAEVTFRTAAAAEAIWRISKAVPNMLVGAGTVLTTSQAADAQAAGARFIVAPGFNPRIVEYCLERTIPVVPGCATPSEMEQALEQGLEVIKFFPAEPMGGLAYLKAIAGPYPMLRFLPTGGISEKNLAAYLEYEKVIACGGSWMVKPEWIEEDRFDEVKRACEDAASIVVRVKK